MHNFMFTEKRQHLKKKKKLRQSDTQTKITHQQENVDARYLLQVIVLIRPADRRHFEHLVTILAAIPFRKPPKDPNFIS